MTRWSILWVSHYSRYVGHEAAKMLIRPLSQHLILMKSIILSAVRRRYGGSLVQRLKTISKREEGQA